MKSNKAPKIEAALLKGMSVSAIAKRYDVTPSYVYLIRKRIQPTKAVTKPEPTPEPVVSEPTPVPQFLREDPTPAPTVLVAPRGAWQRFVGFLRGEK